MIRSLTIQNYALIDDLEMEPSPALNIITGETGAGKSIMLGAIGLLVGNRNDNKALLDQNKKCVVEGVFNIEKLRLAELFEAHEIDFEPECIVRREINSAGKSRAFVNDTPVKLPFLKILGSRLLDVHSQHESLQLHQKLYQLNVLDAFAGNQMQLENYKAAFKTFSEAKKKHVDLREMASQSAEDEEYKWYLLNELEAARLDDLNQEESESELEVLENAEEIKRILSEAAQLMDGDGPTVLNQLSELRHQLAVVGKYSDDLEKFHQRLESTRLELMDLSREIELAAEEVSHDPEKIQSLKDSLDLLYKLQSKHKVQSTDELISIRQDLEDQLSLTHDLAGQIRKAEKALEDAYEEMMQKGELLTESRKLAALDLAAEIEKIIHKIGIENGRVDIIIERNDPTVNGLDEINIRFSANKGVEPKEISKVASGGEFSRLIFAIKYLIASKKAMPTVIFDEIDTGVSGEVAIQMISMMKEMSRAHQVISISHLPQFAAGGDSHYFVYKDHAADRSVSKIRKLDKDERVEEIAKMIGGKQPTDSAFSSARELMGLS